MDSEKVNKMPRKEVGAALTAMCEVFLEKFDELSIVVLVDNGGERCLASSLEPMDAVKLMENFVKKNKSKFKNTDSTKH